MADKKKCGWGKNTSVQAISLSEVMSEQMADDLQREETSQVAKCLDKGFELNQLLDEKNDPDLILAKILQMEYDKEFEEFSRHQENSLNDNDENDALLETHHEEIIEEEDDDDSDREWDMFEKTEKIVPLGKVGYVIEAGGRIRTKHDPNYSSRMNACRAMNMNISTGDGGGFDMKLNNNVYNSLKTHVRKEKRRFGRMKENSEKSTAEGVMDENSRLQIFRLVNMDVIDQCNGIISTGKESNVYHGMGSNLEKKINLGEVAIKVFKTTKTEFKNRSSYIRGDYRFKDRLSKTNSRKLINLWAEKEMHNLSRLQRGGILCPKVVMLKKHILVMSFLGKNGTPSPTLREAVYLNEQQMQEVMIETIEIMKRMYDKCDLIHGDLSEYNLLYHMGHVYVIDVGQSVLKGHPNALKFLLRDCNNISRFFLSRGMVEMVSGPELFFKITGHEIEVTDNLDEVEVLKKIFALEKDTQMLSKDPKDQYTTDYLFEEMLVKSKTEKKQSSN